ncbi:MAG: glucose-1-phosphate adenylyltransferase, partial [Thiomonas sp.]
VVNRSCHLNKVIVDRGCVLPEGMVIGEDPVLDAKRFERTSGGVVLVTKKMLCQLGAGDMIEDDDD